MSIARVVALVLGVFALGPPILLLGTGILWMVLKLLDAGWPWWDMLAVALCMALLRSPLWKRFLERRRFRRAVRQMTSGWTRAAWAAGVVRADVVPLLEVETVSADLSHWEGRLVLPAGMVPEDVSALADRLESALGAVSVRVMRRSGPCPGIVIDYVPRLVTPVAPGPLGGLADLACVPIGVTVDGSPFLLRLRGSQVLIAGQSGSGKGSFLWSILWALAERLRDGSVQVWTIDAKGGLELASGRPLFAEFATSPSGAADLLDKAAAAMRLRARVMAGRSRLHEPTRESPHVVILIDELAALTAYNRDSKERKRIEAALGELLTQGRALGFTVVACVQDPSKEVLGLRQLFFERVALRLAEGSQIPMVLGAGAQAAGARPDLIPNDRPGMAYLVADKADGPVLGRAFWISDQHIEFLTEQAVPTQIAGTDLDHTKETIS